MNVYVALDVTGDARLDTIIGVWSSIEKVEAGLLDWASSSESPGSVELVREIDQFRRYEVCDFIGSQGFLSDVHVHEIGVDE